MNSVVFPSVVTAAARGRVVVAFGLSAALLLAVAQFIVAPVLEWVGEDLAGDEVRLAADDGSAATPARQRSGPAPGRGEDVVAADGRSLAQPSGWRKGELRARPMTASTNRRGGRSE